MDMFAWCILGIMIHEDRTPMQYTTHFHGCKLTISLENDLLFSNFA